MWSKEFLAESNPSWNLSVGTELSSPKSGELATVKSINDYNLSDKDQRKEFAKNYDKFKNNDGSRRGKENFPSVINLNSAENSTYAHTVIIEVTYGDRTEKEYMYVFYDDQPKKVWSNYAGTTDRKVNLSTLAGRKKLNSILAKNLLPLEPIANAQPADSERSMSAGDHWQVVTVNPRSVKARDRIKPNEIGNLYNTERDFWTKHPDVQKALDNLKLAKSSNDSSKIGQALKDLEAAKQSAGIKGPSDEMFASRVMSVDKIPQMVLKSSTRRSGVNYNRSYMPARKKKYLAKLINQFLDNPNSPGKIYPMSIIDDTSPRSMMTNIGVSTTGSVTADFMEVVHPVAVVTGNATGNAGKMILNFLGAKSFEELTKTSSVSYGSTNTGKLVDSYIYNKTKNGVKKVQLSSKAGAGSQAGVKSLEVAYNEVMRNQTSKKMWDEDIVGNPDYEDSLKFFDTVIENKDYSWKAAVQSAIYFNLIDKNDAGIIQELASVLRKNVKDKEDEELDEARKKAEPGKVESLIGKFSRPLRAIYDKSSSKKIWEKIIVGLWTEVITEVNKDTAFGNLVVWLFNHSATIQVNTYSQKSGDALILRNIVATWPTQLVETAQLTLGSTGEVLSFSLKIDGYNQLLAKEEITEVSPLNNRQDVKGMPAGEDPLRPDQSAKVGTPGGPRFSRSDKELAMSRSLGTASAVLPPEPTRIDPDGTPIEPKEKRERTPRQPKVQIRSSSPGFQQVQDFFNRFGVTAHGNLADFSKNIIGNKFSDLKDINRLFKEVVKNPVVLAAITKETADLIGGLTEARNPPAKLNSETVNEYLTLIYWSLYVNSALHGGGDRTQLSTAVTVIRELMDKLRPGFFERQMAFLVRAAEKQTATGASTASTGTGAPIKDTEQKDQYDGMPALQAIHAVNGGNGMKAINDLRAEFGKQSVDRALQSYTWAQFKAAYMPSQEERRIRSIIAAAQKSGRAQNEKLAREEILGYGLDNSDEDLISALSETKRSRILQGILQ